MGLGAAEYEEHLFVVVGLRVLVVGPSRVDLSTVSRPCGREASDGVWVARHLHFDILGRHQHSMVVCDKEGDVIFSEVQLEPLGNWGYGTWRRLRLPWVGLCPLVMASISSDNVLRCSASCFRQP